MLARPDASNFSIKIRDDPKFRDFVSRDELGDYQKRLYRKSANRPKHGGVLHTSPRVVPPSGPYPLSPPSSARMRRKKNVHVPKMVSPPTNTLLLQQARAVDPDEPVTEVTYRSYSREKPKEYGRKNNIKFQGGVPAPTSHTMESWGTRSRSPTSFKKDLNLAGTHEFEAVFGGDGTVRSLSRAKQNSDVPRPPRLDGWENAPGSYPNPEKVGKKVDPMTAGEFHDPYHRFDHDKWLTPEEKAKKEAAPHIPLPVFSVDKLIGTFDNLKKSGVDERGIPKPPSQIVQIERAQLNVLKAEVESLRRQIKEWASDYRLSEIRRKGAEDALNFIISGNKDNEEKFVGNIPTMQRTLGKAINNDNGHTSLANTTNFERTKDSDFMGSTIFGETTETIQDVQFTEEEEELWNQHQHQHQQITLMEQGGKLLGATRTATASTMRTDSSLSAEPRTESAQAVHNISKQVAKETIKAAIAIDKSPASTPQPPAPPPSKTATTKLPSKTAADNAGMLAEIERLKENLKNIEEEQDKSVSVSRLEQAIKPTKVTIANTPDKVELQAALDACAVDERRLGKKHTAVTEAKAVLMRVQSDTEEASRLHKDHMQHVEDSVSKALESAYDENKSPFPPHEANTKAALSYKLVKDCLADYDRSRLWSYGELAKIASSLVELRVRQTALQRDAELAARYEHENTSLKSLNKLITAQMEELSAQKEIWLKEMDRHKAVVPAVEYKHKAQECKNLQLKLGAQMEDNMRMSSLIENVKAELTAVHKRFNDFKNHHNNVTALLQELQENETKEKEAVEKKLKKTDAVQRMQKNIYRAIRDYQQTEKKEMIEAMEISLANTKEENEMLKKRLKEERSTYGFIGASKSQMYIETKNRLFEAEGKLKSETEMINADKRALSTQLEGMKSECERKIEDHERKIKDRMEMLTEERDRHKKIAQKQKKEIDVLNLKCHETRGQVLVFQDELQVAKNKLEVLEKNVPEFRFLCAQAELVNNSTT